MEYEDEEIKITKGDIAREIMLTVYVFVMGALCGFGIGAFFV